MKMENEKKRYRTVRMADGTVKRVVLSVEEEAKLRQRKRPKPEPRPIDEISDGTAWAGASEGPSICENCKNPHSSSAFSPICFRCGHIKVVRFTLVLACITLFVFFSFWGLSSVRWYLVTKPAMEKELQSVAKEVFNPARLFEKPK